MTITAGLDVGGAHLKVALVENARTAAVQQIACPLWQGLDKLDVALAEAAPLLARAARAGVTMTGELSDLFPDRQTGVAALVHRLSTELQDRARFWMGPRGFGGTDDALLHHRDVGSTNFLATATLIGTKLNDALLVDFGSTTADLIPVLDGTPRARGLTDAERQVTDELVYTGFTRTAVMGVASRAPFQGRWVGLAREYLATMADVRRILGVDLDGIDLHATADGKGKSLAESIARLARMLGRDGHDGTLEDWRAAAAHIRAAQLRSIEDGAARVLSGHPLPTSAPVVAAGIGADEVGEVARRLGRDCVRFGTLISSDPAYETWATACAPAVSVAHLVADAA
jgi:probable H4MPT-linked C1 transfer pathway protein